MNMMKKYLFMLAAFIAVAVSFTACSSEEDAVSTEEPVLGDAIKAQFTISIPTEASATTRQNSTIVNAAHSINDFRGINFIKLYPSALLPTAFDGSADAKIIGKNIALTNLIIPTPTTVNNYIPDKTLLGTNNSVLYGDVQLQLGARTFLFYGMAVGRQADKTTAKAYNATLESYTWQEKFVNGFLNQTGLVDSPTDVSGVNFSLESITTTDLSNAKRAAIVTYLNSIANTTDWSSTTNTGFGALYSSFTSMTAGSSTNLQIAVKDLYFALKDNNDALAQAICTSIKNDTYVTIDDEGGTLTFKDNIAGYPATSDHLPDGAAVLSWSGSSFSYSTDYVSTSSMDITNLASYVYPACQYYWGKSGILTAEESKQELYVNTKSWSEIATEANYDKGNAITSKTRSVVLVDPVQYAVGRLDISVVPAASSGATTSLATLTDAGVGADAHTVNVNNLKLTGVLIGGQKAVDWKFEPMGTSESTIYDNIEVSHTEGGLSLQTNHTNVLNHTMVLESIGKVGDIGDAIKVALEFVNNDKDFVGQNGIVPKGTKFYLIGELKAEDYKESEGYTTAGGKVFKQDCVTRAKFTIANLSKALNVIPDLRNPKVELGLSVDLDWKQGIVFDVVIN